MEIQTNSEQLQNNLETIYENFKEKLSFMENIWKEIGFTEDVIAQRFEDVHNRANEFFNEMLKESNREKNRILKNIKELLIKLKTLQKQLNISEPLQEDMCLVDFHKELEKLVKKYEQLIECRLDTIRILNKDVKKLSESLGQEPVVLPSNPLPRQEKIDEFREYYEKLQQLLFEREELYFDLQAKVKDMLSMLERKDIAVEQHIKTDGKLIFNEKTLSQMKSWHGILVEEVTLKQQTVTELREKVSKLWEILEENAEYRSEFLSKISGISSSTIEVLQKEIVRCEEKKRENIKMFVDRLRKEIVNLWEKCLFGNKQRDEFNLYHCEFYTEDLLGIHEIQVEKLRKHYEINKKLYDLITKRNDLWQQCNYLAAKANSPNRYKNRGGALLKEEKKRKEINIKLPQIEEQILNELRLYEEKYNKPFIINDENLKEMIMNDRRRFKEEQTAVLSAKKKARDMTITPSKSLHRPTTPTPTPSTSANSRSALKRKNVPLTPQVPINKRTKLTAPTSVPVIKVNNQTIKRVVNTKVRRRLSSKRRSVDGVSLCTKARSDYDQFKEGISVRSSTVHDERKKDFNMPKTPTSKENKIPGSSAKSPLTPGRSRRSPRALGENNLRVASPLPFLF